MITYKKEIVKVLANPKYIVFLDKKHVGQIKKTNLGWQYFPKGSSLVGEPFETLEDCKKSLEED
jgi:hypothetical protein